MRHNWKFSPDYYRQSLDVLETSLSQLSAYKSWQAFDPGREYPIDSRYAAMPALKLEEDNTIGYGIVSGTAIKVFPDGSVEALGGATHQYIRHSGRVDRISDILPITR